MKKNILVRTDIFICAIIISGFLITALLSYRANYSSSVKNIEQVSALTSEGIYYQITNTFTKPINTSLTMANDSLLKEFLSWESIHIEDDGYIDTLKEYLRAYKRKYDYDSVFLVSTATGRYYNFNGLDRVLEPGDPENAWYFGMLNSTADYSMNVDNDEVKGAENKITVFVNCKIKDDHGNVLGVVGVGLQICNLQKLLQSYQDKFGVKACLVDEKGMIEISTDYTGYEKINLFEVEHYNKEIQKRILNWRNENEEHCFWASSQSGREMKNYVVTRYLSELNWHLVVEQDTGDLIEKLHRQMTATVLILILILSVILLVITHVVKGFTREIMKLAQDKEQEHRTVFEKVTKQLYENIYELDITHNCPADRATEEYFERLGAPSGTPYGKALKIIAEKQIKEEFRQGYLDTFLPKNVLRAFENGQENLKYDFMIQQDGQEYYWMRITAQLVKWESDGSLHMLVYRQNIDSEKKREKKIQELAQTDEMTGMLTKTATGRKIDSRLREDRQETYALFIFDIDNFKNANDQFGHSFGDEVIQMFAHIIRGQFEADDILGRIGGDEFAAFVRGRDQKWVSEKAKELSETLHFNYCSGEKSWGISASIGIAFDYGTGKDYNRFYKNADKALYVTKRRGKNGFTLYREEM